MDDRIIEVAERLGAPPSLVLMLVVAAIAIGCIYRFIPRESAHPIAAIALLACLAIAIIINDKLPRSEAEIAREFADSSYAINEQRLDARYPLGWGLGFADGGGGIVRLKDQNLLSPFSSIETPIVVSVDERTGVAIRMAMRVRSEDRYDNVIFSPIEYDHPAKLVRIDGIGLLAELAKNERDGIIIIFGLRSDPTATTQDPPSPQPSTPAPPAPLPAPESP